MSRIPLCFGVFLIIFFFFCISPLHRRKNMQSSKARRKGGRLQDYSHSSCVHHAVLVKRFFSHHHLSDIYFCGIRKKNDINRNWIFRDTFREYINWWQQLSFFFFLGLHKKTVAQKFQGSFSLRTSQELLILSSLFFFFFFFFFF